MSTTERDAGARPRSPAGLAATVVVPVRNGGAELTTLVDALAAQTLGRERFEVVIADDGSSDEAVRSLPRDLPWLRISSGPPRNSYAARNRGAALSSAPVLAFSDADCRPEPNWLEAGLAALERADIVAGLVLFDVPRPHRIWSLLDIDTFLDQERAVRNNAAASANLFVRRSVFLELDGFDDVVPNQGDHDFVGRAVSAGAELAFCQAAVVRHPTRDDARGYLKKDWSVNRRYAQRQRARGLRPEALKLRSLVPFVQPLRARRRFGRTIRLDRARLGASGIRPTLREDLLALPLQYLVLPYMAVAAQARGWLEGAAK
jgi:glycosyltransferase involved in cell wall biosynthesis